MKKRIALLLAAVLLLGVAAGATIAWLTDTTEEVKNTFTTSNINIDLDENTGEEYKMIPGWTNDKDPFVTVKADSEDCWVFIKVEKTGKLDDYISYAIDPNNWEQLKDGNGDQVGGVYVTKSPVMDITQDRKIKVLGYYNGDETPENFVPNKVLVKDTVTKDMMDALSEGTYPTLNFTAYATQYWKNNDTPFTPAEAWEIAKPNP